MKTKDRVCEYLLKISSSFVKQLRVNDRPMHSAISLSLGVFVACSPFYGLQTFLIVIVCAAFRLNIPLAILGSQISLPPIYALILPAELYVGFHLMGGQWTMNGEWLELARTHFSAWFVGSLVVGAMLAAITGVIWLAFQQRFSKMKTLSWTRKQGHSGTKTLTLKN